MFLVKVFPCTKNLMSFSVASCFSIIYILIDFPCTWIFWPHFLMCPLKFEFIFLIYNSLEHLFKLGLPQVLSIFFCDLVFKDNVRINYWIYLLCWVYQRCADMCEKHSLFLNFLWNVLFVSHAPFPFLISFCLLIKKKLWFLRN